MLKKLIKYEFKASFKLMYPIYIGMVGLTLLCKMLALPLLNRFDNFIITTACVLLLLAFFIGLVVLAFMPIIISGLRFKKAILSNEGYLTMTLPVSSHKIIISKLIVNIFWYTITALLLLLIGVLMVTDVNELGNFNIKFDLPSTFTSTFHLIISYVELFINYIAMICLTTLIIYAGYAIGYSCNKAKSLVTVICIYLFFHLTCWLIVGGAFLLSIIKINVIASSVTIFETLLVVSFMLILVICLIYYFTTYYFITKKLNLE